MKKNNKRKKRILVALKASDAPQSMYPADAFSSARLLYEKGYRYDAEFVLEQLVNLCPKELLYKLRLANVYLDNTRRSDALTVIKNCRGLGQSCDYFFTAALVYFRNGLCDTAMSVAEKGIKLFPKDSQLHLINGHLLSSLGDKDGALSEYRCAVDLDKENADAWYCLSRLSRGDAVESDVDELLSLANILRAPEDRARIYYSLAQAFSGADVEKEMAYLNQGNSILYARSAWNKGENIALSKKMRSIYSEDFSVALDNQGRKGPVFVVGMPRSGSSLIEQIISSHSEVVGFGETGAFSRVRDEIIPQGMPCDVSDADTYFKISKQMSDRYYELISSGDCIVLDKSLENFWYVPELLVAFPGAKIIYADREPLDIILSCYQIYFSSSLSYTNNLEALAERYNLVDSMMAYWEREFPDNVFRVDYQRLVESGEKEIARILEFCNLPWEDNCQNFYQQDRLVMTASLDQVNRPLYSGSVGRWKAYGDYLGRAKKLLDKNTRA